MKDLHHSDILTYALTRMATEFARDKQRTLRELQKWIGESNHRRGLGGSLHEELDDAGPGYTIRTPQSEQIKEDTDTHSTKTIS
jgi:hypothetical protein